MVYYRVVKCVEKGRRIQIYRDLALALALDLDGLQACVPLSITSFNNGIPLDNILSQNFSQIRLNMAGAFAEAYACALCI